MVDSTKMPNETKGHKGMHERRGGSMGFFRDINEVPVRGSYDVIVVGGGIGGVSAAVAARRHGCTVLIIEKGIMLGGLATAGFIAYFLPLCDGLGRKVSSGLAEELLHLSIKYGYGNVPETWLTGSPDKERRYSTIFSPPEFVYALDELVRNEKIDVLFDTLFCKAIIDEGRCSAVIVENKAGRSAYKAKVFIDATGDADLFFRAGSPCIEEKNYLAYWYYRTDLEMIKKALELKNVMHAIRLEWKGSFKEDGSYTLGKKEYRGTDPRDITRFVMDGRRLLREDIEKNKEGKGSILAIPSLAQYRRTRRIKGIYSLKERDALKFFDDSVGCVAHWLKRGIVYEIPYRTMVSKDLTNVIAAGRLVAASGDAWEVTRVIPGCAVTGHAAGTAAAIAAKKGCPVHEIPIDLLQKKLKKDGVILHHKR